MVSLRTNETHEKYRKFREDGFLDKGCNLCSANSIKDFEHWRIVENLFPYDKIAKIHNMIILKRHARFEELNESEKIEFESLKAGYINDEYEFIIEPTLKKKTIPLHMHLHLIVPKEL